MKTKHAFIIGSFMLFLGTSSYGAENKNTPEIPGKENTEKTLTDIQATHLLRIVQEAVNNAYKYSQAQNICIHLEFTNKICFSITDDGIGFEASAVQNGNGLKNMQSRITELKGVLQIKSEPNKGTKVSGCF